VRLRLSPLALAILSCIFALRASAQQASTTATQNPQAVALATNSIAVLSGSVQIADITLSGTATRIAGSDVGTGTVTLRAFGTLDSRMDLSLSSGTFSEIRNAANGTPQGSWLAPNGSVGNMAMHNCFTDAAWFFPALTVLSQTSNPNLSITYVGLETKNGTSVQHLTFAAVSTVQATAAAGLRGPVASLFTLSSTDVYLNSSSLLPVAFVFSTHPDNDALTNIPVEIDFSNYQAVNGVQIPFNIQKFLNGSLFLDLTIQAASLNSGLTDSVFVSN
jgi:hypothetical protein